MKQRICIYIMCVGIGMCAGCATLFGWDIHAPGILSHQFYDEPQRIDERIGLFIIDQSKQYVSTNRGGALPDPQTYHIGEALEPMLIEAFNASCNEFIYLAIEPTDVLLKQYAIPYVVVIEVTGFDNRVTLKGQSLSLKTNVFIFDSDLTLWAYFEAEGSSDAKKVFAKRGGPEVNLNAALENNIDVTIQFIRDLFLSQKETAA